jgi:hypothetical protein
VSPPSALPSRSWLLVQSFPARCNIALWVWRSRPAVGLSLGFAVFMQRTLRAIIKQPAHPLFEFSPPAESDSAEPCRRFGTGPNPLRTIPKKRPNGNSHGLSFPIAHAATRVHLTRVLPARYVPPAGFFHPLDGLLPSEPRRSYFVPAALSGFLLRSVLLQRGHRVVSARKNPHTVSLDVVPFCRSSRPAGRAAVSGLFPSLESSDGRTRYERAIRRMLPWIFPT